MTIYNIQPRVNTASAFNLLGTNGTGFTYFVKYRVNRDTTLNGVWAYVKSDSFGSSAIIYPWIQSGNGTNLRTSNPGVTVNSSTPQWVYLALSSPLTITANTDYNIGIYGQSGNDVYLETQGSGTVAGHTHINDLLTITHVSAIFRDGIVNESYQTYQDASIGVQLEGNYNTTPNAPIQFNISNLGSTINGKPKFYFYVTDPDVGNTLTDFQIQISSDSTFATVNYWDATVGNTNGTFTGLPTTGNTSQVITVQVNGSGSPLPVGTWYMRARVKDNNGAWSSWSITQAFTIANAPWSDTINTNDPAIKADWMNQIATVINNARQFRGLATFSFTDGTLSQSNDKKPIHITERRTKLTDVLSIVGVTPTWTNSTITSNVTDSLGQHIIELRNYCSQT